MHFCTSVFIFCVVSATRTMIMVESYGFRYSRTPGSSDCRLLLNLPGYPPSYHSPIANSNHRNKPYSGSTSNSYTGNRRPASSDGYAFSSSSTTNSATNSNRRPVCSGNYHEGSQSYNQATSKGYQTLDTPEIYCKSGEYYSQFRQRCILYNANKHDSHSHSSTTAFHPGLDTFVGSGTSGTIKINEEDSYNSKSGDYDSSSNYNGGSYDNYESSNSNYNSGESYNSNTNYNSDKYGTSGNNYVSDDSGSNYNSYNFESSYEQSAPDQDYNTNTNYNLKNHGTSIVFCRLIS